MSKCENQRDRLQRFFEETVNWDHDKDHASWAGTCERNGNGCLMIQWSDLTHEWEIIGKVSAFVFERTKSFEEALREGRATAERYGIDLSPQFPEEAPNSYT